MIIILHDYRVINRHADHQQNKGWWQHNDHYQLTIIMIVLTRSSQPLQTGGQPAYSVLCIGRNRHRLAGSGGGSYDDSTKSWWLGSRSGLFIINMIIKIIMIIFVIIIIWFRAHGRGDSVLCFVRRWQDPAGREWRAALQPNIRIPRQRHFHHHVHRLIMMIIINHHHRPWWSL